MIATLLATATRVARFPPRLFCAKAGAPKVPRLRPLQTDSEIRGRGKYHDKLFGPRQHRLLVVQALFQRDGARPCICTVPQYSATLSIPPPGLPTTPNIQHLFRHMLLGASDHTPRNVKMYQLSIFVVPCRRGPVRSMSCCRRAMHGSGSSRAPVCLPGISTGHTMHH